MRSARDRVRLDALLLSHELSRARPHTAECALRTMLNSADFTPAVGLDRLHGGCARPPPIHQHRHVLHRQRRAAAGQHRQLRGEMRAARRQQPLQQQLCERPDDLLLLLLSSMHWQRTRAQYPSGKHAGSCSHGAVEQHSRAHPERRQRLQGLHPRPRLAAGARNRLMT